MQEWDQYTQLPKYMYIYSTQFQGISVGEMYVLFNKEIIMYMLFTLRVLAYNKGDLFPSKNGT